jgi:hypothetical protein
MRLELTELLGVELDRLPAVFLSQYPKPLKLGIFYDLIDRARARPRTSDPVRSRRQKGVVDDDGLEELRSSPASIAAALSAEGAMSNRKASPDQPLLFPKKSLPRSREPATPKAVVKLSVPVDHACKICGAYGSRSSDHGKTWRCLEHDPHKDKDLERLAAAYARQANADPNLCQACSGAGCPHCQPERFGLPARKPISTARQGTTQEK